MTRQQPNIPTTGEWELFDLVGDPQELRSVYEDPAHARVRSELRTGLDRLRAQYRVPPDEPGFESEGGIS